MQAPTPCPAPGSAVQAPFMRVGLLACAMLIFGCSAPATQDAPPAQGETEAPAFTADLVVLDATPAGIAAAISVERAGFQALILSPYERIGGLTTSGLGATDVGNKAAIGGLAREFYEALGAHYAAAEHWTRETRDEFRGRGHAAGDAAAWTFEPQVALETLERWLASEGVQVVRGAELDRGSLRFAEGAGGARRIESLALTDGRRVAGRVFIDASYEGDLLAAADVPHTFGREPNERYGETLNGVQLGRAVHHQFGAPVDAYWQPGDPDSGLLPELDGRGVVPEGSGDDGLQAFCFRLCLTDDPERRVPFAEPAGYDPRRYELLLRWFDGGADWVPMHHVRMPNRKTDTNNNGPVSTDWIGGNRGWLEADLAGRAELSAAHREWIAGLLWTLAHHPRVPEGVRAEHNRWGFAADEFSDTDHWPPRLYVREGRRLVGDLVMTEHHCRGRDLAPEPIGLAAYTMDSHNVHRRVVNGQVLNEGDVQVGGFPPYPIGYRALLPPSGTVDNLAVPVCLSASHIAYGSIRMEPVFFVLGQAAGTAAVLALQDNGSLHDVPYGPLRERLLAAGAVLEWSGAVRARTTGLDPASIPGLVFDDAEAEFEGPWAESTSSAEFVAAGYRHDGQTGGGRRAHFDIEAPAGHWRLELGQPAHDNRATNVRVLVRGGEVAIETNVDQRAGAPGVTWREVAQLDLKAPTELRVTIDNEGADGYVIVDALRLIPWNEAKADTDGSDG
ncbi:MAG: FAD-dependent oxidoreductase [Planctomycetota bacterium]